MFRRNNFSILRKQLMKRLMLRRTINHRRNCSSNKRELLNKSFWRKYRARKRSEMSKSSSRYNLQGWKQRTTSGKTAKKVL